LEPLTYFEAHGEKRPFVPKKCTCEQAQEEDRKREQWLLEQREYERKMSIEQVLRDSMIPKRWEQRIFESFKVTPANKKAFDIAKEYADKFNPGDGDGLLFSGSIGTGKTHLAAAITMALIEKEVRVTFGTFGTLLAQLRNAFDGNGSERDIMRKYIKGPLLVIDDLGKEKVTDWVEQTIYEIVNTRYEDNKSLIITTNLDLAQLRQRYPNVGDAMVDRIIEMCRGVKLNGESWRRRGLNS